MSEANLGQDPNEFLGLATNESADPQGQPTIPNPAGEQPTEEKPKETPENPIVDAPVVDEVIPKPNPSQDAPSADPKGQPTKTVEEMTKDQEHANKKISKMGEEKVRLFKTNLLLVNKNPDLIKDIQNSDPDTAQQIVKEKWGYDSFDELMAHAKIDEMKESDPDGAKREERLLKVEKDNERLLTQLHSGAEETFYKDKGIMKNPFDPKYQAIQEAIKSVHPSLLKEDYNKALNLAYTIAFPSRTTEQVAEDQKKILLAKNGNTPIKSGNAGNSSKAPSEHSEAQNSFASAVGQTI